MIAEDLMIRLFVLKSTRIVFNTCTLLPIVYSPRVVVLFSCSNDVIRANKSKLETKTAIIYRNHQSNINFQK